MELQNGRGLACEVSINSAAEAFQTSSQWWHQGGSHVALVRGWKGTPSGLSFYLWGSLALLASFPGSPPHMTTMNSKEGQGGDPVVPFRTWCNGTNVTDISVGKFRRHSCADHPFSYSVYLRVWSLGPLKRKERLGYAVDGARQFAGTNFCNRRVKNERVAFCSLYWTVLVSLAACIIR